MEPSNENRRNHGMQSSRSPSPDDCDWARKLMDQWKGVALSNSIIYTFGFVSLSSSAAIAQDRPSIWSTIFLFALVIVSFVIQAVIPIAIFVTLPAPNGLCPNQSNPLTKFIGLILCLFFVILTISMCLSKLRGMAFLKLFCGKDKINGCNGNRLFLDIGILSNMVSMGAAGVAQYLLFIRNAEKDYVLLLLQSLAMQFVLTADEKLMTSSWSNMTRKRLETLMKHDQEQSKLVKEDEEKIGEEGNDEEVIVDDDILKKVRLMYFSEAVFLIMVSTVGIGWSIALAYCM